MSRFTASIHVHTPTLMVVDPRGLDVRSVAYCRAIEAAEPEERINRSARDAIGRLVKQWDPRLGTLSSEGAPANLSNHYSLSGKVLGSLSVDAGERISLFGDGDQLVHTWDSRYTERRLEYDNLLRPLAILEQGKGEEARCTERYEYANADDDFAAHNQCAQLIRHDDPAGTQTLEEYALTGGVLEQTQRFLQALAAPDWPLLVPDRDALLEPMAQAATSATRFNPLGDVLEQTDAKGNRQLFDYTVDGQLFASHLQLSSRTTPQTLVSDIAYNAYGQVEQETAGNGVVSTLTYRAEDGRLLQLRAARGAGEPLQDLHYDYDPVGNVLSIRDDALPIRYFANQRVEAINRYSYDSLDQLIKATGWEAGAASRGPGFNRFDDPGAVANYEQTYHYDAGGNLLELVHVGPQGHSRKLRAARYSNRCLPERNGQPPTEAEIAAAFDGNGNLLELQPGQTMAWDLRNQLREVRPVERESADDDRELYLYGGDGMRRRKVRSTQTNARSLISEVRYLPSLEIRTHAGTGKVLQVICVQAGRSAMQVLHWETPPPSGISNDQYRYNLTDHLGSSSLELDSDAQVISRETYHPYGGTAWFAGRDDVEASYKTVRYSGKERDATGLYYYGFRYYATWLQRWVNPDPSGTLDGLNLYLMVKNCPIVLRDIAGLAPVLADGSELKSPIANETLALRIENNKPTSLISYEVDDLGSRLAKVDKESQGRAERIAEQFNHKIVLGFIAKTTPKVTDLQEPSKYFNVFNKHEWEFKQNFKYADSGKIFANDVARHQYRLVAEKNNFFGHLPSTIRRSKVINAETLNKTKSLESGSAELFNAFWSTPNGKTTQRVMEDFGLKALAVRKETNGKYTDFIVDVEPIGAYRKVESCTAVPIANANLEAPAAARPISPGFLARFRARTMAA